MKPYSASIIINAGQEDVWKIFSDVPRWHEWTPTVTRVEVLDTPDLKAGSQYKVIQPKLQPAIWRVTVLTPPSNFTWESNTPGMRMVADHIIKSINTNQTKVTLTFAFQGLLGELVGRIYRTTVESYLTTEAQSLKKRVENL